jgi:hypothetical protein
MLFFLCERCKFKSPGSEARCQTCGARVSKQVAVKEVIYYPGPIHRFSLFKGIAEAFARAGQYFSSSFEWLRHVPTEETEARYNDPNQAHS